VPINVKTSVYEGPLDLLLDLIEKRKLLINDISLASVTDEYIARINEMHEMPVAETADFVSLAATLLLINPARCCRRSSFQTKSKRHPAARVSPGAL